MSTDVIQSCKRFPPTPVRARLWLTFEGKVSREDVLLFTLHILSTYRKVEELRLHYNAQTDEVGNIIGWTTTAMMHVKPTYEGDDGALPEDASSVHNL